MRTNGSGSFTTLAPRQPILPTPYAVMANTASNLLGTLPAAQLSAGTANVSITGNAATATAACSLTQTNFNAQANAWGLTGLVANATSAATATNAYNLLDGAGNVAGYSVSTLATNNVVNLSPNLWVTNSGLVDGWYYTNAVMGCLSNASYDIGWVVADQSWEIGTPPFAGLSIGVSSGVTADYETFASYPPA